MEKSPKALDVARSNAELNGVSNRAEFYCGGLFEPLDASAPCHAFQVFTCNPPYVDPDRPELLDENVRRFEPAAALFAPRGDPLHSYKALLTGGVDGLRSGATVLLEVGVDSAAGALSLVQRARFYTDGALIPDLAGCPRVLACRRK